MRRHCYLLLLGLVFGICPALRAAPTPDAPEGGGFTANHTQVKLLLPATTARPGDTVLAGVELTMEPGWHTYWKNPGEAGQATEIKWQLPPGISAGDIQWPLPEKLPPAEITTYGYRDAVVLLVPLKLAANLPAGPVNLAATVSWLECKESCLPASAPVAAQLTIGPALIPAAAADRLQSWGKLIPSPANGTLVAEWETAASTNTSRRLLLHSAVAWMLPPSPPHPTIGPPDFFPAASTDFEFNDITAEPLAAEPKELRLHVTVKKFSGDWPTNLSGVLNVEIGGKRRGYEVQVPILEPTPAGASATAPAAPPTQSLWQMLLFAFIGGLILNLMPCVLPVIALKILGFVGEARSEPRHVRRLGLLYTLGVLVSFLALAALVIGAKAAGHQAGWGMQFGSPVFLVCLTTLVTLVALNLFGVFEVILGGRALGAAGTLAARPGAAGAFFNGVLATVLATPCTAPFLSIALGFAFAQSGSVIAVIFLAVGLGLAAPYLLLSWQPAWLKFLPKPGAWMEKFKIAMGFPMLATVVWLYQVAASSYGKNIFWLGIFLVIVAFAAWIYGEFFQRRRQRPGLALAVVLLLLASGYWLALEKELDWRRPPAASVAGNLQDSAEGIIWQPWSAAAVAQARAEGRPVLVDFTADWCLTCQVNKKTSLEIAAVREKLTSLHAVTLLGDYTHFPDAITQELQRFHRAGVPLVLMYPRAATAAPIVLPEVLTPGIVLSALAQAAP